MNDSGHGSNGEQVRHPNARSALELVAIALLFAIIGIWYAGPSFLNHIASAIPSSPMGGGTGEMTPGDQFEQYYRHMLPYFNLMRGNWLYYSGYEYNLGSGEPFSEGLIFFPFSLIASALAFLTGPVTAYNAMAILSFCFAGVAGYLLGKRVTNGSVMGGLIAASICALLPFRVSFLFGEMVYGTDFCLIPLSLYFFLVFLQERRWEPAAAFGTSVLFLATANFTILYWYAVFFLPFFVFGSVAAARHEWTNKPGLAKIIIAAGVPLTLALVYVLYVKGMLDRSGLAQGQDLSEVRFYSPTVDNLFSRWSGNEKTIYLGFSAILAILGTGVLFIRNRVGMTAYSRALAIYCAVAFPLSYLVSMGLSIDDLTGVPLYRFVFEYLPGANGSRTPGRVIPITAVCAAVLAPIAGAYVMQLFKRKEVRALICAILVGLIAFDFHFSRANMALLDRTNNAYSAIAGNAAIAVGIPFQREADHYLNATYQFFAITHNVRMVNGHSSMFPAEWASLYPKISGLNSGVATRAILDELTSRGVRYILAHNTAFEPRVGALAIEALDQNPGLKRLESDDGVVVYQISDVRLAPREVGIEYFAGIARGMSESDTFNEIGGSTVSEVAGWYSREAYPGQMPFRWMEGTSSVLLVHAGRQEKAADVVFDYKCPTGSLTVLGQDVTYTETPSRTNPGWTTVTIDVRNGVDSVVAFSTPSIYTVPSDSRRFGCMIGDFTTL